MVPLDDVFFFGQVLIPCRSGNPLPSHTPFTSVTWWRLMATVLWLIPQIDFYLKQAPSHSRLFSSFTVELVLVCVLLVSSQAFFLYRLILRFLSIQLVKKKKYFLAKFLSSILRCTNIFFIVCPLVFSNKQLFLCFKGNSLFGPQQFHPGHADFSPPNPKIYAKCVAHFTFQRLFNISSNNTTTMKYTSFSSTNIHLQPLRIYWKRLWEDFTGLKVAE